MYISLNWLRDFVEIPDSITPEELALRLTTHTVEIEKIEKNSKLNDIIFEVDNKSITHRPDLWGHYGIAREISAFLKTEFKDLDIFLNSGSLNYLQKIQEKREEKIIVENKNPELCQRYMAIEIKGIKITKAKPSEWIQKRLVAAGIKPINNIVDITNYVMLEFGQPIHAFDKALVGISPKVKIIVRKAKRGESIKTLDGKIHKLEAEDLIIANSNGDPIAIAGIIGGVDSSITDKTETIIIEVANFNYLSIRKTSQRIGTRTESSMRYEKQPNPILCEIAMARLIELIKKICLNAEISSALVDIKNFQREKREIKLDLDWLNRIIGKDLKKEKVVEILTGLGFGVNLIDKKDKNKNRLLSIKVPDWRGLQDISIPEDLLEEIVRIYGYENLKPEMPIIKMEPSIIQQEQKLERKIRNILVGGPALSEVYNYSFVGEEQLNKLDINFTNYIRLTNPLSNLHTLLRQNLMVNLIENVKINQENFDEIGLFEIGSVYFSEDGDLYRDNKNKKKLPRQEKILGIVLATDKKDEKRQALFTKIKGIIEYLLKHFNLDVEFDKASKSENYADIKINKNNIGTINILKDDIIKRVGIKKGGTIFAEINLKKLLKEIERAGDKKYKPIEKYPSVIRDLAFVVDAELKYIDIRKEILGFDRFFDKIFDKKIMIKDVKLFDVFIGKKLGDNKKSLAFHITYQSNKTLTSKEVDDLQKRLISHLSKKFRAKIRDF